MVNEETARPYETPRAEVGDPPRASTTDERNWAFFAHLSTLSSWVGVPGFVGPLVIWLMKKDQNAFVGDQAKESLNFQITMFMAFLVAIPLCFVFVGFLILPILVILDIAFPILAAVRANKGESYRYPFCIRLIS